jgi:hypothetical protein
MVFRHAMSTFVAVLVLSATCSTSRSVDLLLEDGSVERLVDDRQPTPTASQRSEAEACDYCDGGCRLNEWANRLLKNRGQGALTNEDFEKFRSSFDLCHSSTNSGTMATKLPILIEWLCDFTDAKKHVSHRGVRVAGSVFAEKLDLSYLTLPFPLQFDGCRFEKGFSAKGARFASLSLSRCRVPAGGVDLSSSIVDGSVDCAGINVSDAGLSLDNAEVKGDVVLCHAHLSCPEKKADAFSACGLILRGDLRARDRENEEEPFTVSGCLNLLGARINGNLDLRDVNLLGDNEKELCLTAERMRVDGRVFLGGRFCHRLSFSDGKFGATFELNSARLTKPSPSDSVCSLEFDRCSLAGTFVVDDTTIARMLSITQSSIQGRLVTKHNASFGDDGLCKWPLVLNGSNIGGGIDLAAGKDAHVTVKGQVSLEGCVVAQNTDFSGTVFQTVNPPPERCVYVLATAAKFEKNVLMKGTVFVGQIALEGAVIAGDLDCTEMTEGACGRGGGSSEELGLNLTRARIGGKLVWKKVPQTIPLRCVGAEIGCLDDTPHEGPECLEISDAIIHQLGEFVTTGKGEPNTAGRQRDARTQSLPKAGSESETSVQARIGWLEAHMNKAYSPGPYEQLAAIYERNGEIEQRKQVLIAMERMSDGKRPLLEWCFRKAYDVLLAYGFEPWRALEWGVLVVVVGAFVFSFGKEHDLLLCVDGKDKPDVDERFLAWIYSLDTFIPVFDLRLAKRFRPVLFVKEAKSIKPNNGWVPAHILAWVVTAYWCFHTVAGWVLVPMFAAAMTGLLRK